jgi:predicted RND superfamily exporter protein
MADNFDMKKFLVENKLGAYSKLKNEGEAAYEYEKGKAAGEKLAKEDLGKDLEDTEAADMMDFLAEDETNPKAKKELDAIQKQIVAAQSKLNSFRKVYKDKYNKASKEKQKQLDAALKAAEKDFEKTVTPLEAQSKKLKENKESLNEDASQTVIDILGILAGLAGMGLSGVQILKWQDKLEKENPELHKQLGKVSSTIGGADPSKNLEENEDAGGIENDIEQDLMYTEDPILYLKSIIDFCNKKIEEIEQDTDGIEEAKKEEIKEALTPEAFERMDALTSTRAQLAMIKAAEIMMNELTKEGFEVLDIREYFTQLIANDI